uniref:Uncharacterized protein n=1 Tax=Arundo donax TaxID=35708 RepID=A0A0A8YEQ4_ARUDO
MVSSFDFRIMSCRQSLSFFQDQSCSITILEWICAVELTRT